jgi:predicted O-methyltransferase YrrM
VVSIALANQQTAINKRVLFARSLVGGLKESVKNTRTTGRRIFGQERHGHTMAAESTHGKLYNNKDAGLQYASKHSLKLIPAQEKLIEITLQHPWGRMLGSPDEIQLLQNLCRTLGAKKTLDIGVFTGYSSLSIALVLPPEGKVYALDINDEYFSIGQPFRKEAGIENKIEFIKGPAVESLQKLLDNGEAGTFDFAFIDADKQNYDNYYELSLKLLRSKGIIALDNMLWGGSVYNEEKQDADTQALRAMAEKVSKDDRVNCSFLCVGDGTMLAFKK